MRAGSPSLLVLAYETNWIFVTKYVAVLYNRRSGVAPCDGSRDGSGRSEHSEDAAATGINPLALHEWLRLEKVNLLHLVALHAAGEEHLAECGISSQLALLHASP